MLATVIPFFLGARTILRAHALMKNVPKPVLIPFRHAKRVKAYADAASAAGLDPVAGDVEQTLSLDGVAGLLLMGGTDVNPARYGAEPDPKTETPDDRRDQVECELIERALERDLPVLAICRGLQILNVCLGGTLIQHLANTPERHDPDPNDSDRAAAVHPVQVENGTLLQQIAQGSMLQVNSRHHQAAGVVGQGLIVSARDPEDGTIEALERRDRTFVVAVQWHPEDQVSRYPEQLRLFERFASAISG